MKAKVNEERCTGCGPCEDICPQVFKIEDDLARVQVEPVPPEAETGCRKAMEACPSNAISLD